MYSYKESCYDFFKIITVLHRDLPQEECRLLKKRDIISKLGGLMGKNRLVFFQNLVESDVTDLIDEV